MLCAVFNGLIFTRLESQLPGDTVSSVDRVEHQLVLGSHTIFVMEIKLSSTGARAIRLAKAQVMVELLCMFSLAGILLSVPPYF